MADRTTRITGNQIKDGTITNDEINASAGIEYSKLDLTDEIVDADISTLAAISHTKLAINNEPQDGYVLAWSGDSDGTMTWVEDTLPAASLVAGDIVGSELSNETPNNAIVEFTHDDSAVATSVQVFLNGLLQQPGSGKDYAYNQGAKKATFALAPDTGDIVLFCYVKA